MASNSNLHHSRADKADEFYTQLSLIESELKHYKGHVKDKVVLCNCDDPFESNFFKYFAINFNSLGLKKLIATCYATSPIIYTQLDSFGTEAIVGKEVSKRKPYKIEITEVTDENKDGRTDLADVEYLLRNRKNALTLLQGDGDFRSPECIELLKQADIVVTNPPFSLFREYMAQLMEYQKDFSIVGNQNSITYREILPLIRDNDVWLGYNNGHFWFSVPDTYEEKATDFKIDENSQKWRRMGNICFFTNLDIEKRHEDMTLFRQYSPDAYPKYDNYDAIEVSRTADIPCDYYGVMGVPITFMQYYNPNQFEILGDSRYHDEQDYSDDINVVNGKTLYRRILIRRRQQKRGLCMNIKLHEILAREVVEGYIDCAENGVTGYNGRLNIRPSYQREFIYKDKQRDEVVRTVQKNFPLNVMYWVKGDDGNFEVLDGQQRTISLCQYVNGDYSIDHMGFDNLTQTERQQILDYPLMIYICEGTDKEKLDWFKIINIAGEQLTAQELRNAIYTGEWLTEAKKYFSKTVCPAYTIASNYLNGSPIRQNYLETAICWLAARDGKEIVDYMAEHQHNSNCNELWLYFQSVINWVKATFPNYRKEMKGLEWGVFYNKYCAGKYDPKQLEARIVELMDNEDVSKFSGIYEYLLGSDERHLSIRAFTPKMVRVAYERQIGICPKCKKYFEIDDMQADHITPWSKGGKTIAENCQMLCADCNRRKSNA